MKSAIAHLKSPEGQDDDFSIGLRHLFLTNRAAALPFLQEKLLTLDPYDEKQTHRWSQVMGVLAAVAPEEAWRLAKPVLESQRKTAKNDPDLKSMLIRAIDFRDLRKVKGVTKVLEEVMRDLRGRYFVGRALDGYLGEAAFNDYVSEKLAEADIDSIASLAIGTTSSLHRFERLLEYLESLGQPTRDESKPYLMEFELLSALRGYGLRAAEKGDQSFVAPFMEFFNSAYGNRLPPKWKACFAWTFLIPEMKPWVGREAEHILNSDDETFSQQERGMFAKAVAIYLGDEALPILDRTLPRLVRGNYHYAYETLMTLAILREGKEDRKLAEMIAVNERSHPDNMDWHYCGSRALMRLSGESAMTYLRDMAKTELEMKNQQAIPVVSRLPDLVWHKHGWTLRSVLQDFVKAGLLAQLPDEFTLRKLELQEQPSRLYQVIYSLKSQKGLCHFNVEADELPVPYDRLIQQFADNSRGQFKPENIRQRLSDDGKDYVVSFVIGNNAVRFRSEVGGDWFDTLTVVKSVNKGLELLGKEERFLQIDGLGQDVGYLFGDPTVVTRLCEKLGISVTEDLSNHVAYVQRTTRCKRRYQELLRQLFTAL